MSIKVDIRTLNGSTDFVHLEYAEEGHIELSLPLGISQVTITTPEARELAAALYGMVHLS